MSAKGWIFSIMLIIIMSYSVFSYKLRNSYNVDKQNARISVLNYEQRVLEYAYSLLPKKEKDEVFFNSIKEKYPKFKDSEDLCKILRYKKTEEEIEQDEKEEAKVEPANKDTTVAQVMDNIISDFGGN